MSDARARQTELERTIKTQKAQVAKLDDLQTQLKSDIRRTTVELRTINVDLARVRKQVATVRESVAAVEREYERLVGQLSTLDVELVRLRDEQAAMRATLRERLDVLAERIRGAYDASRRSILEVLLSEGSFVEVLAVVSNTMDAAESDKQLAAQIETDRNALATLQASVEATREQTNGLRQEAAAQRRELDRRLDDLEAAQTALSTLERDTERELAKQRAAYTKLAKNEASARAAVAASAEAQRELGRRIEALIKEQASRGRIPSEYSGTLEWPYEGRITQEFGCTGFAWEPPLGSCANFHRGIDMAAPRWTPVRASGDGVVVFAGPNPYDPPPKAWIVIIAHSSSLRTWYAHVDNERPPTVRAGEAVKRGQVIAYVGSTGRSTGYHTDWRVELRGTFVNPRQFL